VKISLVKDGRREVIVHRQRLPNGLGLRLVGKTQDSPAGTVVRRDEYLAVRIDGRGNVQVKARAPRVAPQKLTVLRSDTDGCFTGEEDNLRLAFDVRPDRTALAKRLMQRLPDDAAVLLIQGGDRLTVGSSGLNKDLLAYYQRTITVAVGGAVAAGNFEKILTP